MSLYGEGHRFCGLRAFTRNFMGFWLSSDQTAADQARFANNFALGFQSGEATRARKDAQDEATARAIAVQRQADAANLIEKQLQVEGQLEAKRMVLADNLRQDENERTQASITGGLKAIGTLADKYSTMYDRMLQNPAAYSKESFNKVSAARSKALGFLSQAQAQASNIRPGQIFDASPYTNEISGIVVEPEFNQTWLDLQTEKVQSEQAKQDRAGAYVYDKMNSDGTITSKTTPAAKKFSQAIGYLGATQEAYDSALTAIGGQAGYERLKASSAKDPLYNIAQSAQKWTREADANGALLYNEILQGKHGDQKKQVAEVLIAKGIQPFKSGNMATVGDYFGEVASGYGDGPLPEDSDELSIFFTGKPVRFWQTRKQAKEIAPAMQRLGFSLAGVPRAAE